VQLTGIVSLLAPPLCWGCGADARRGGPLCGSCRAGLRWLGPEPVEIAGGGPAPALELWAPLAYDGAAREIVRGLKFHGALALAESMAAQIVAAAPARLMARVALVPVPLTPSRRRRRGFNQAELLARAIGERTALPVMDCLRREGAAAPQVGRGRSERISSIRGTIGPKPGAAVPAGALIVDDVATTGATLGACASALRSRGAARVAALAYARTLGR
jgi:predicted amidophosphoribosyltransferase